MAGRRSTYPDCPTVTMKGLHGRARPSIPAPRGPLWTGCGAPALVLPDDAQHDAPNQHVTLVHADRRHLGVGGLQSNPAAGLAKVLFARGALAPDQGDDGVAVVGMIALVHDDVIAVADLLVDHRPALNLQD